MKVLQVHNIAHITPLVTRELEKRGIASKFAEDVRTLDVREFDIIHGHYALNKKTIRAFRAARRHDIPFIIHCHGSDVRRVTAAGLKRLPFHYQKISQYIRKRAAKVFLSTPDLIPFAQEGEYVPNPVDLESFRPLPDVPGSSKTLIAGNFFKGEGIGKFILPEKEYDCINVKGDYEFPANVKMRDFVPHDRFARFLNGYTEMLGTQNDLVSMTRMEAMACGLGTFTNFDKNFEKFYDGQNPDEASDPRAFIERFHDPKICVERFIEVYEDIVRARSK